VKVILIQKDYNKPIRIPEGQDTIIGRGNIIPPMIDVSREHFSITWKNGSVLIIDLSRNGTSLGEARTPVSKTNGTELKDGDKIYIGGNITYFVVSITN